MEIRRWDIIRAEVERNARDTREESWKLVGSGSHWAEVVQRVEVVGRIKDHSDRRHLVLKNLSPCISAINKARKSLGLISPREIKKCYFKHNPQYGQIFQPFLIPEYDESWASVKSDFEEEPRIRYSCSECQTSQGHHDQKVLEWGFFEWIRKNPGKIEQVWQNAKINSDTHDIFLFVGNQAQRRSSFLIISILPIRKEPKSKQLPLF